MFDMEFDWRNESEKNLFKISYSIVSSQFKIEKLFDR